MSWRYLVTPIKNILQGAIGGFLFSIYNRKQIIIESNHHNLNTYNNHVFDIMEEERRKEIDGLLLHYESLESRDKPRWF